jgi:hypothetical protein
MGVVENGGNCNAAITGDHGKCNIFLDLNDKMT